MNRLKANCATACLIAVFISMNGMGRTLWAQETMQGSTIFGTITDTSGAAVAGATAEVTSPALQGSKAATSDSNGSYRIADLPAGIYRIAYSRDGFETDVRTDFTLTAGFAARVDVALKVGSVTQTVEVSGQAPVIDTSTSVTSNTLVRVTLDDVPTTRSIYQAVYMTAGIRPSATPDVGGSQLGNQQSTGSYGWASNATMLLEGINVLQSNSLNAGVASGDFVDYDALDELKVVSTGADADTGPPGTLIVAVMKSGGNEFHGDARGMGEWKGFQRTNLPSNYTCVVGSAVQSCADTANQLQYFFDGFGDVGGRIIRDKLWFYGGVHLQRNNVAVIGYVGPNGGQGFSPLHQDDVNAKVTYQVSKNVKLIGDYTNASKVQPQRNGGPTIAFPSTWIFYDHYHTAKGEVTWTPSPKILVDILGGNYWQVGGYPDQPGHFNIAGDPWTINETTGVNTGPVRNLTSGSLGTHNRLQYTASVGYFPSGKHSFQFGTMIFWPQRDVRNLDAQLDNYEVQLKTNVVTGAITPFQLLTFNIPQNSTGREKAIDLYAKDTWRVSSRLTINPGVRFDHYRVYHDAEPEPGGNFYAAATYPAQTDIVWNRPEPRIGLAYDLRGDGKTVLRASYGQYNIDELGQFDITWYNPGGITTTTYSWTGPCVVTTYTPCDASAATLASLGTGTTTLTGVSGGATGIVNPNLKEPYMQTATVTVERQLMANLAVRALYVYNQENRMFGVTYPNRPISDYTVPYTGTPAGSLVYPATDPANAGKPLTIYTYPVSDNCPNTNPICPFNATEMVNRKGDTDHYQTFEFTMTKLESHKWSALFTVDLTKSHEWLNTASVFATTDYSAAQPVAPYQEAFPLNTTWDWAIKSYFTYELPYRVQLGLNYQYLAGQPNYATDQFSVPNTLGTVYIPVNQWGSERTPPLSILNIRIAKIIQFSEHKSLTGSLELFNALNNNAGTTVNYIQGAVGTSKQFGFASVINPPMIGRLGLQFKF